MHKKRPSRIIVGMMIGLTLVVLAFLGLNRDTLFATNSLARATPSNEAVAQAAVDLGEQAQPSATSAPLPTPSVEPMLPSGSTEIARLSSQVQFKTHTPTSAPPGPKPSSTPTDAPSPMPQPSDAPLPTSAQTLHSVDCLDSVYLADVTIPDNSRLEKGASFVKTWRVRNDGSCDWPTDAYLAFVSDH